MITTKDNITLDELRTMPVVEEITPPLGKHKQEAPRWKWQAIPHHTILNTLIEEAAGRGIRVDEIYIALSADRADMTASLILHDPKYSPKLPTGLSLSMGLTTSNAGRRAFYTYYGVTTIWGAGIPLGNLLLQKRHTFGLDLDRTAEEMFNLLKDQCYDLPRRIERLKERSLSVEETCCLLVDAGDQEILPSSRIVRVLREYNQPETAPIEKNSWGLLHAFAVVARINPPLQQMQQVLSFRESLPVKGERK